MKEYFEKYEYYKRLHNKCKHKVIVRVKKVKFIKLYKPYWIRRKIIKIIRTKKPIFERVMRIRYRRKKLIRYRPR